MSFIFKNVEELPGIVVIDTETYVDDRGFFMERYKSHDFSKEGVDEIFVQENFSHSEKNVIRGLHYQEGNSGQGKLVQCLKGVIFDVAVDIRKDSAFFGKWFGVELSEFNHRQLFIPAGFAHGFAVASDGADVSYLCTKEYSKADERGIVWNDNDVNISWPIKNPIVSEKDAKWPRIKDL